MRRAAALRDGWVRDLERACTRVDPSAAPQGEHELGCRVAEVHVYGHREAEARVRSSTKTSFTPRAFPSTQGDAPNVAETARQHLPGCGLGQPIRYARLGHRPLTPDQFDPSTKTG